MESEKLQHGDAYLHVSIAGPIASNQSTSRREVN
jgi:hypothetical protein